MQTLVARLWLLLWWPFQFLVHEFRFYDSQNYFAFLFFLFNFFYVELPVFFALWFIWMAVYACMLWYFVTTSLPAVIQRHSTNDRTEAMAHTNPNVKKPHSKIYNKMVSHFWSMGIMRIKDTATAAPTTTKSLKLWWYQICKNSNETIECNSKKKIQKQKKGKNVHKIWILLLTDCFSVCFTNSYKS